MTFETDRIYKKEHKIFEGIIYYKCKTTCVLHVHVLVEICCFFQLCLEHQV